MQAQQNQTQSHTFNPTVLREYDIRGIVGETLFDADAYAIGVTYGTILRRKGGQKVVTGFDGRISSPSFQQNVINGLRATGCDVVNIGLGPTPMTYFAAIHLQADGAIMITGSHNPSNYNGFKFVLMGKPFYGAAIAELGVMSAAGDWDFAPTQGTLTQTDIRPAYIARLMADLKPARPLKIAWDAGNGSAGEVLQELVKILPGEHHVIYADIDGNFPNHHPDPTVDKNLTDLIKLVRDNNCDVGIAFDGDGDRIGAVDEQGNIIRCDSLLGLYAAEILSRNPGATVIGDIKCSDTLFTEIKNLGGTPIMWKTGHSLIKAKMAETGAPLAGELSGHIFMADGYYGYDDALYCAIRLINIIAAKDAAFSTHFAHLPKRVGTAEIRIDVEESRKFEIMDALRDNLAKAFDGQGFTLSTIDGIRLDGPGGWLLLRPSNTQNCLATRIEADNADILQTLKSRLADALSHAQLELPAQ